MQRQTGRQGFSLLEVLVVLLCFLFAGFILLLSYRSVSGVRSQQQAIESSEQSLSNAIRQLGDLFLCTSFSGGENSSFILEPASNREKFSRIAFSATRKTGPDRRGYDLFNYRVYVQDGDLILESAPAAGVDSGADPARQILAQQVREFNLQIYNGEEWVNAWEPETGEGRPGAVSMKITGNRIGEPGNTVSTRIFIPAGNPVYRTNP